MSSFFALASDEALFYNGILSCLILILYDALFLEGENHTSLGWVGPQAS